MKSAKPAPADASSHRRSQPVRQARTNPPRKQLPSDRTHDGSGPSGDQPIDIFPAITHFADTMTALPKELVRHFTLLKEVDAKVFGPQEELFKLVAASADPTCLPKPANELANEFAPASVPMTAQNSSNSVATQSHYAALAAAGQGGSLSAAALSKLPRDLLLRQTALKIHEMLVSLEEKNHVLSTANEALQKQLTRIEDVWPHLEDEFSDEAKWGSTAHWAYPENRSGKQAHAERTRRDGAAAISAAAQALADEAAARSDARKQALQAKKSLKNAQAETDLDEADGKPARGEGKKTKSRKTAEAGIGLGITPASGANGNPPPKKRKVDNKNANGAATAERAMASVFGGPNQPKAKTNSPRGTPAPDGPKKRKALPSASGQSKKSKNGAAASPSVSNSPVVPPLPEPKSAARNSPAPNATPRPPAARSRQNSLHSTTEGGKARAVSAAVAAASKSGGQVLPPTPEAVSPKDTTAASSLLNDLKPGTAADKLVSTAIVLGAPPIVKSEPAAKQETERSEATSGAPTPPVLSKKDTIPETVDRKSEPMPPALLPPVPPTVTTKSGRASKPSTPALATFQEGAAAAAAAASSRSRLSRANDKDSNGAGGATSTPSTASAAKKGHKKSGSTAQRESAVSRPPPPVPPTSRLQEDETSSAHGDDDDDGDIDADEPRYCYCNGVSYGEMVACDSDDCTREWFHLACVGLKVAPGSKTKWYCEDCKERLKSSRHRTNGR